MRRFWFVALIPVVLLVGGAVALGVSRPVHYKASAVLSVGNVYGTTPVGITGVVQATETLASVYSRSIHAADVHRDASRRLARKSLRSSGTLAATPIPDSPLIRVTAESSSPRTAVALANAGGAALAAYVEREGRPNSSSALIRQYEQADVEYQRRLTTSHRLAQRYEAAQTRENREARDKASAAANAARLRRDALGGTYQNSAQGEIASPAVEMFAPAAKAVSDRASVLQMLVFIGAVGGIAVGAALALLLAQRRPRRRPDG